MFTISTVVTNTFALPIGILLDYVGPRNTSLLGAVCFALGNLFFGLEVVNERKQKRCNVLPRDSIEVVFVQALIPISCALEVYNMCSVIQPHSKLPLEATYFSR